MGSTFLPTFDFKMSNIIVQDAKAIREDDNKGQAKTPERFLKIRENIRSTLTANVTARHKDAELNYLINTTQALITTNNEIWDRCKTNLDRQDKKFNHLSKKPVLVFYRVGFNEVKVLSAGQHRFGASEGLMFETQYKLQTKSFTVPCLPPSLLSVVIPVIGTDGLLSYSQYLERSFILEESILLPFLAIFKDHLEEFQVFLGDVESWLMGSIRSAIFTQQLFNVAPKSDPAVCFLCVNRAREKRVMCERCELEGCFRNGRSFQPPVILYKTTASSDDDVYKVSFDVSNSSGQKRLTQFFSFVKLPVCDE